MFESDTDTEVIPKLCKFLYSRLPEPIPFPQLVRAAIAPRGCVEGQGRSSKGVGRRACRSLDRASYNAAAPIAMRTPLMPRCTPHFAALPPLREHSFHPPGVRGGQAAGGRVRPAHQVRRLPWRAGGLPPRLPFDPGHEVWHPGGWEVVVGEGVGGSRIHSSLPRTPRHRRPPFPPPRPPPPPPLQAAATPRTPNSPNTPLTPKLTGTSSHGPQFFDSVAPNGATQQYGLELFLASEASAVVEHTKQ